MGERLERGAGRGLTTYGVGRTGACSVREAVKIAFERLGASVREAVMLGVREASCDDAEEGEGKGKGLPF